jgi:hypothetical protein
MREATSFYFKHISMWRIFNSVWRKVIHAILSSNGGQDVDVGLLDYNALRLVSTTDAKTGEYSASYSELNTVSTYRKVTRSNNPEYQHRQK